MPRSVAAEDVHASQHWHLTFDMSGMRRRAKPAGACPLDGRVSRLITRRTLTKNAHAVEFGTAFAGDWRRTKTLPASADCQSR